MASVVSERLRRGLVADMRANGALSSAAVTDAFVSVAREHFLPEVLADGGLKAVYRDDAIVVKRNGEGLPLSSSSQPTMMAKMLELLDVQPGDRVLEIGAGTGNNAALLAHLTGPSGRVTSIDIDPDLARRADRSLRAAGVRAQVVTGDGRDGHPPDAPYERIIATAGADEIPAAWLEQLTEGGRLELPLRLDPERGAIQLIPVLRRCADELRSIGLTWGVFMPLHGGDGGWQAPLATITAVHTVHGQDTDLASLSGQGISQLSRLSAARLLACVLSNAGTTHRSGLTDLTSRQPPLLLLFLLLNIAPAQRLSFREPGRWGVGLVDRASQGAAIVSLRSPWSDGDEKTAGRTRWRLDAYGPDAAATQLDALLSQWRELEHAGQTTLRITARGGAGMLRLSFTWDEGNHATNALFQHGLYRPE